MEQSRQPDMHQAEKATQANVLFVDDEVRVLTSMRAMFRRDYNVLVANSGEEAIDLLQDHSVQVIVSDQRMPGMTGIELLNRAKEIAPSAVRILLTGYADLDAIEASINESEVFRYLTKPCSQQELKQVIELARQASLQSESVAEVDESRLKPETVLSLVEPPTLSSAVPIVANRHSRVSEHRNTLSLSSPANLQQARQDEADEKVELLLLSRDEQLIAALESALHGERKLHIANSVETAIQILEHYSVGVLVTDTAINEHSVHELTAELRSLVPQLVTIIASDRSDAQALIALINYGQIFRFLLKPIPGGQCRIWIQSAVKKHLELVSTPETQQLRAPLVRNKAATKRPLLINRARGAMQFIRRLLRRASLGRAGLKGD